MKLASYTLAVLIFILPIVLWTWALVSSHLTALNIGILILLTLCSWLWIYLMYKMQLEEQSYQRRIQLKQEDMAHVDQLLEELFTSKSH